MIFGAFHASFIVDFVTYCIDAADNNLGAVHIMKNTGSDASLSPLKLIASIVKP